MTLEAFFRLGFYFVARLVQRLFRKKSGLLQFHENYSPDRLLALTSEEQQALVSFSGCLACGLCDAAFSAYPKVARRDFHGPSDLPLSYSRSLADYDGLIAYLGNLERGDLVRLERVCPARIPFRALARFAGKTARATATDRPAMPVITQSPHDPG